MEVSGLVFNASFDSGNLSKVTVSDTNPDEFLLSVAVDCEGAANSKQNNFRSWFYFTIDTTNKRRTNNHGRRITLTITNLGRENKLFDYDFRPVVCVGDGAWEHVSQKVRVWLEGKGRHTTQRASWTHTIGVESTVAFAMSFPFTYEHQQREIEIMEAACDGPNGGAKRKSGENGLDEESIYFFRETLAYSVEGRKVDLLTISGYNGLSNEREDSIESSIPVRNPYTGRPHKFPGKKLVIVTARVHPGESPSSFVLQGFLRFLLSRSDPRALAARKSFVFKIVPMLNPDGVVRGHYRTDSLGQNLNRLYDAPDPSRQPTIYAVRALLQDCCTHFDGGVACYLDVHAHASRRGCFVYGNTPSQDQQVTSLLFPKLMALNSAHFDFAGCDFSESNTKCVKVRKHADGADATKEGTARVALGGLTGLVQSYTLEVSYNTGATLLNQVVSLKIEGEDAAPMLRTKPPRYCPPIFQSIGRSAAVTILDMCNVNPLSRLSQSSYHNFEGLTLWMEKNLRAMMATLTLLSTSADNALTESSTGVKRSHSLPFVSTARSGGARHRKSSTTKRSGGE